MRESFKKITGAFGALALNACSPDTGRELKTPEPTHETIPETRSAEVIRAEHEKTLANLSKKQEDDLQTLETKEKEEREHYRGDYEKITATQREHYAQEETIRKVYYETVDRENKDFYSNPVVAADVIEKEIDAPERELRAKLNADGQAALDILENQQIEERRAMETRQSNERIKLTHDIEEKSAQIYRHKMTKPRNATSDNEETEFFKEREQQEMELYKKNQEESLTQFRKQEADKAALSKNPAYQK